MVGDTPGDTTVMVVFFLPITGERVAADDEAREAP